MQIAGYVTSLVSVAHAYVYERRGVRIMLEAEIANHLQERNLILNTSKIYADDTTVYKCITTRANIPDGVATLQQAVDALAD